MTTTTGILIAAVAVLALLLLMSLLRKSSKKNAHQEEINPIKAEKVKESILIDESNTAKNDEEAAAFLALHLYMNQNIHDVESNILTIQRIQRRYSPWSSKIYSMNNFQR